MNLAWLVLTAALNTTPAEAEEFGVPVNIPSGSVIELTIEKSGEQTVNGTTNQIGDLSFQYRQEIAATDDGYTVSQTFLGMKLPEATSAEDKASMEAGMAATRHIAYDTDQRLLPVRIRDSDALVSAITAPASTVTPEQLKAQEQTAAMFRRMSPENLAALLLREQATAAAYQGMALPVGETLEVEGETPNPFGVGPGIRQVMTAALTGVDEDKGVAVVETNSAVDPDSFKAALPEIFRQMAPDAPKPSAEEMAELTFEKSNACRYEIDLETGLATVTECTDVKGGSDKDGGKRTVTRMRITQKLIKP